MIKKCGRLIVAPASQKHKCASSLHFIYFFCFSFALFHLVGSCFICVLLSIAREPSWLIANAIIALKTARHVGTESRKYAKLAPDRGKKYERSVFQNYALVILDPHAGVLIMHDAFNFDRSAQYTFDQNSWGINNWAVQPIIKPCIHKDPFTSQIYLIIDVFLTLWMIIFSKFCISKKIWELI